jgi:hypothetical protein
MQQAEDRAHRIGQTQSVSVHILICKDSIDELMWETLQAKLATTGQVLDGQAGVMEVDRSSMPVGGGRSRGGGGGAGSGGGRLGAAAAVAVASTPSIASFFTASSAGSGGGDAAKRQRTE